MQSIFNKFLIIFIIFLVIININIISKAENIVETTQSEIEENYNEYDFTLDEQLIDDENMYLYNEDETHFSDSETSSEKNFFSYSSSDITVSDDVYGDAFICSAGTVTIDAFIGGNVFICASNIKITNNAQIVSALFACSNSISIEGGIEGNVYSASQDCILTDTAYIAYDLFVLAQNTTISGTISRDAYISSENINLSENAYIYRNLNYSSNKEITIPDKVVYGSVNYKYFDNTEVTPISTASKISEWFYDVFSYIVITLIIFGIVKLIKPKFIKLYPDFIKNLPKYVLYGIVALIVIPIISIILLIPGITISLSFILLAFYISLMLIASCIVIINISYLLSKKLNQKLTINENLRTILCIIVASIIYNLLQLIPILGSILTFAVVIIGFGNLLKSLFYAEQ